MVFLGSRKSAVSCKANSGNDKKKRTRWGFYDDIWDSYGLQTELWMVLELYSFRFSVLKTLYVSIWFNLNKKRSENFILYVFRTNFDSVQLTCLESEFQENPYLLNSRKKHISAQLQIDEKKVKIWFQNRRAKLKRSLSKGSSN